LTGNDPQQMNESTHPVLNKYNPVGQRFSVQIQRSQRSQTQRVKHKKTGVLDRQVNVVPRSNRTVRVHMDPHGSVRLYILMITLFVMGNWQGCLLIGSG